MFVKRGRVPKLLVYPLAAVVINRNPSAFKAPSILVSLKTLAPGWLCFGFLQVNFRNKSTVLSIIASTQLGSTLVWGFVDEVVPAYIGFFLYGAG